MLGGVFLIGLEKNEKNFENVFIHSNKKFCEVLVLNIQQKQCVYKMKWKGKKGAKVGFV